MKTGSGKASRRERQQRAKERKIARIGIGIVAIAIAATPPTTTFATRALPTERGGNHAGCLCVCAAGPAPLCSEDCGYTAMLRLAQEQSSWRQRRIFGALGAFEEAPLPVAAVSVGPLSRMGFSVAIGPMVLIHAFSAGTTAGDCITWKAFFVPIRHTGLCTGRAARMRQT